MVAYNGYGATEVSPAPYHCSSFHNSNLEGPSTGILSTASLNGCTSYQYGASGVNTGIAPVSSSPSGPMGCYGNTRTAASALLSSNENGGKCTNDP